MGYASHLASSRDMTVQLHISEWMWCREQNKCDVETSLRFIKSFALSSAWRCLCMLAFLYLVQADTLHGLQITIFYSLSSSMIPNTTIVCLLGKDCWQFVTSMMAFHLWSSSVSLHTTGRGCPTKDFMCSVHLALGRPDLWDLSIFP